MIECSSRGPILRHHAAGGWSRTQHGPTTGKRKPAKRGVLGKFKVLVGMDDEPDEAEWVHFMSRDLESGAWGGAPTRAFIVQGLHRAPLRSRLILAATLVLGLAVPFRRRCHSVLGFLLG